ncbi:MAG: hypothetical protein R3274_02355 [Desulfobacterales bacterium]|nr:hypothetical protein [Desulfobacterales bacterium]
MTNVGFTTCSLFITLALSIVAVSPAAADIERIRGTAISSDGNVVFFEEHIVKYTSDRIATMHTTYYDADFNQIGRLATDFSQGSQFGSYDFTDERLLYKDGARVMTDRILIYSQKTAESGLREKIIQRESDQIVGQGFHPFIVSNLAKLANGAVIPAKLVLPAQMDQYDVRIYQKARENDRIQIRIEMDNWFLRLFAPHVEVEYDIQTRQLVSYRGVSVVADASGKTIPITVSYEYTKQRLLVSSESTAESTESESN